MSLMTNNGKIITSEDKPILVKGVTLKEVEQLIKDSTITDTNKVIPAQNVSLQTLHDTYGDCFVGRVTYTGFNVLFLFSYNKDEDYYNLTTYYGTQLKAYTHVDMTQDVITLIKHTTPTYSNTNASGGSSSLSTLTLLYSIQNQMCDDGYMYSLNDINIQDGTKLLLVIECNTEGTKRSIEFTKFNYSIVRPTLNAKINNNEVICELALDTTWGEFYFTPNIGEDTFNIYIYKIN